MSLDFTYSDKEWEEEEWPFSMDVEIIPKSQTAFHHDSNDYAGIHGHESHMRQF